MASPPLHCNRKQDAALSVMPLPLPRPLRLPPAPTPSRGIGGRNGVGTGRGVTRQDSPPRTHCAEFHRPQHTNSSRPTPPRRAPLTFVSRTLTPANITAHNAHRRERVVHRPCTSTQHRNTNIQGGTPHLIFRETFAGFKVGNANSAACGM